MSEYNSKIYKDTFEAIVDMAEQLIFSMGNIIQFIGVHYLCPITETYVFFQAFT